MFDESVTVGYSAAMPNVSIRPPRHPQRVASLVILAALASPVWASPSLAVGDASLATDAIGRFLAERGLIEANAPAEASAFAERVRDRASDMVSTATNFLGVRYRRGGNSPGTGFDCSGFTRRVFEMSVGLVLPRRVDEQAKAPGLVAITRDALRPGDLVFFNTLRRTFSHVGIYVGGGKFIHAPRPGGEVRVEDLRFAYWAKRFSGARRAEPVIEPTSSEPLAPAAATPISTLVGTAS